MNIIKTFVTASMAVSLCMGFSSCSDDDDAPALNGGDKANPAQVFTSGTPKKVGEMNITTSADGDTDEWWFKYNSDGQLNYMKRSEGGNEVTTINYTNGDITSVSVKDDENYTSSYTTTYGNSVQPNKGCIMLFDLCFGIDMDEMDVAYYAGLLGKATKNLPAKLSDDDGYYSVFEWKLNASGLPQNMICRDYYPGGTEPYTETISFNW